MPYGITTEEYWKLWEKRNQKSTERDLEIMEEQERLGFKDSGYEHTSNLWMEDEIELVHPMDRIRKQYSYWDEVIDKMIEVEYG